MTFPDGTARQENTESLSSHSVSRSISKLKDQQALPGEKESIVLEELNYTTKDLNVFAN